MARGREKALNKIQLSDSKTKKVNQRLAEKREIVEAQVKSSGNNTGTPINSPIKLGSSASSNTLALTKTEEVPQDSKSHPRSEISKTSTLNDFLLISHICSYMCVWPCI